MNKPPRAFLASEASKVACSSYNRLMPRVSGPYEVVTVLQNTFVMVENGIKNIISIDCASNNMTFKKDPAPMKTLTRKGVLSQTQMNEKSNNYNDGLIAEKWSSCHGSHLQNICPAMGRACS